MIPSRVVAVKGILVFWKSASFAGRRQNEGLGRSDSDSGQSSRSSRRADDSGCPEDAEEGNAVGMRDLCACTRRRHERSSHAPGDASFARSSGPCTSILTMLRRRKPRRWGGGGGITVGQTRASEKNQHWGLHHRT
jgi:hypothetical protein